MFGNLATLPRGTPQPRDAFSQFMGGLDQETPAWLTDSGSLRDVLNYEISILGGYQDIRGYERFDGQPAPSAASFTILDVTVTGSIVVGDTVTGVTSGATGLVIATGTYPDDPSQTYLVLTKVTDTFDETDEDLEVSAVVEGNTDAEGYADSAPTAKLAAQYKNLAADQYRADIAVVPGEGDVWGGFTLAGTKYAIRNKTGGLTAALYVESAAGWTEVDLGTELAFTSGGTTEIAEGDTITGATSMETATVERVVLTSGTWAGGDAAGYLYLSGQSGAFQAENLDVGASSNLATIAGDSTAITMEPDGRLDFYISNFADTQGADRVYCADGVNLGYEFDGTAFVWIRTGMTDDTPDHVIELKNQLFFSFDGSVQHSGIGTPYDWTLLLGAGEFALGESVTGFQILPGAEGNAALLVAGRQRLHVLYGNDEDDFSLVPYRHRVGAYEWTIQELAYTLFLDDRGITDLQTVQAFGNFDHSALSAKVRTLIQAQKSLATASCIVRKKNQYRLFFTDKTAIYVTFIGNKVAGMMPITLEDEVTTIWSQEDENGDEEIFFGSDNGYVYQMERGTSFDGENIYAFMYTHFDHGKSIQYTKEYFAPVTLEARGSGYAEFNLGYQLSYGQSATAQPDTQTAVAPGVDADAWDTGLVWDSGGSWDESALIPALNLDLRGEGTCISWVITKDSDYFEPLLLSGVHYRHIVRLPVRA